VQSLLTDSPDRGRRRPGPTGGGVYHIRCNNRLATTWLSSRASAAEIPVRFNSCHAVARGDDARFTEII